jgi:hypothetical protein
MNGSIPITLPGGCWRNGALQRDALLRPLRGEDELGETVTSVLRCPRTECDERMDLELRVADLLVPPAESPAAVHEVSIGDYLVRFRLPNGGDLEEAAVLAMRDVNAAARLVLERCVVDSGGVDTDTLARELPAIMAERDPQAELVLNLVCTKCERPFTALFDTAAFLFGELAARRGALYREVHQLAFHYHWSEADILGMTAARRRRYLELLTEALAPRGKQR